jgi:hypothetical protein
VTAWVAANVIPFLHRMLVIYHNVDGGTVPSIPVTRKYASISPAMELAESFIIPEDFSCKQLYISLFNSPDPRPIVFEVRGVVDNLGSLKNL